MLNYFIQGQRLTIALTRAQAQIADQQQALQERSENVRKLVGLKHETEAEVKSFLYFL